MAIYLPRDFAMNRLLSGIRSVHSTGNDVMVDPRIKDLHYTEIIRTVCLERRLN